MAYTTHIEHGSLRAALINERISAMSALYAADGVVRTVALGPGVFFLETAIIMASGVRLVGYGGGRTVLRPTFTGGADDSTNAAIKAIGTVDTGTLDTILAAPSPKGNYAIQLVDNGTLSAGEWLLIKGSNTASNSFGNSNQPGTEFSEIIRIATVAATCTAATPIMQYHAEEVTAKAIAPAADLAVEELDIAAEGGELAVGILFRSCSNATIRNVSGAGFSKSMIMLDQGTRRFEVRDIHCRGEANGVVHCNSAMDGVVRDVTTSPDGLRAHASATAIPRACILVRNRCTAIAFERMRLQHANQGIRHWGGMHLRFSNISIRDMDATLALARGTAAGEVGDNIGVGIDGDGGPLTYNEWLADCVFSNIQIEGVFGDQTANPGLKYHTWYSHDAVGCVFSNVSIDNTDAGPYTNDGSLGTGMDGLRVNTNIECVFSNVVINGCAYGLYTEGNCSHTRFQNVVLSAVTADGSYRPNFGLWLNHDANGSIHFEGLKINNYTTRVWFGADFADYGLHIIDYNLEAYSWAHAVIAKNDCGTGFSNFDVVELDPTSPAGTRKIKVPGGANTRNAVVLIPDANDVSTGFMLIGLLPDFGFVMCDTAAVSIGDLLIATTAHQATPSVSPAAFTVLGRALSTKSGGTAGLVQVGPV